MRKWYDDHWKGSRNEFADFIGVSYSQISNMLADNPKKGGSEETRMKICKKLGLNYLEIIGQNETQKTYPVLRYTQLPYLNPHLPDHLQERYLACIEKMEKIFRSGDDALIKAIEASLAAFIKGIDT